MNPIVDEVKKEYGGKVNFEYVSMDDQAGQDRAIENSVIGYPNILILFSDGRRASLLKGVVAKGMITDALDEVLAREGQ